MASHGPDWIARGHDDVELMDGQTARELLRACGRVIVAQVLLEGVVPSWLRSDVGMH